MSKILFITTSVDKIDEDWQSGIWFEELSTPYYILEEAGFEVEIASPNGGNVPFDPLALTDEYITESVERFRTDADAATKLENSLTLSDVDFYEYDGIFFPGGHAASIDLPTNSDLRYRLGTYFETGRPVGAVCHGPAGLVGAKKSDGSSIVKGLKVTCFSNKEEEELEVQKRLPFLLQNKFTEFGAIYEFGEPFEEFAIRDKNLITGQNPASTVKTAELFLQAVEEYINHKNNNLRRKEA